MIHVDSRLRNRVQLEPVQQPGRGVPEHTRAAVAVHERRRGVRVLGDHRGRQPGRLRVRHPRRLSSVAHRGHCHRRLVARVQRPLVPQWMPVRGQRQANPVVAQYVLHYRAHRVVYRVGDQHQVDPVTHAQPVSACPQQSHYGVAVGRGVHVKHPAAVGMSKRTDSIAGCLRPKRRRGLPTATQDHQLDQPPLANQRRGELVTWFLDKLNCVGVQVCRPQRRHDHMPVQRQRRAERGRTGAQYPGVA